MRFFSRTSRKSDADRPASAADLPADTDGTGTNTSPSSPHRMDSEGYPTWLPQRPPPPAPASTFQSSTVALEPATTTTVPTPSYVGGRKATPRSVRIVSLPESSYGDERRVPTDHTRVASSGIMHPRVWSRATGAALSPTMDTYLGRSHKPRFNTGSLRLDIVRSAHPLVSIYFYFFRVFIFAHLILQTFFDFNAIFILIQVSKYPTPEAPGVPGSGRSWALATAAYIACWFLQVFAVFIIYELVYSFIRRWRFKRPPIYPIYTSTPAFNFACVTSYSKFCFLQNLRYAAFKSSIRDGLAETFWHYSQNLPTVTLLLPRAGLCLALLLTFSSPQAGSVALAATGVTSRDGTFFRDDGTLTGYSRGILIANAAWTAWRALVLIYSWIGLWLLSEQCCAGICGPTYRWEEDEFEKTMAARGEEFDGEKQSELVWSWRECTRERVQELFDFCLVSSKYAGKERGETSEDQRIAEQVMAAVGLVPNVNPQALKRSVLTDDFFKGPSGEAGPSTLERPDFNEKDAPLSTLPYPFTNKGSAQVSSDDEKVPFPPSPEPEDEKTSDEKDTSGTTDNLDDEDMDEDEEDEEEERLAAGSEEPSSGRASGSMSSLGHPISSRYPFQYRKPTRGTSMTSSSNSPGSHATPHSNNRSLQSRVSQTTQSTGNQESSDSHSPRSHYTTSSNAASVSPSSIMSGVMPMPPRHPRRNRAGTVPIVSAPSTPSPVNFPRARRNPRTRADSGITQTFGAPQPGMDPEGDDDDEDEPEVGDIIGLLTPSPRSSGLSPRPSFIYRSRTSTTSSSHHSSSRANSHSGSSSSGARSRIDSARTRAQSFIAAASRSSLELVRPRSRSMVRLEEDHYSSGHSRSGSGSGSGENWTFGQPAAWMRAAAGERREPPSPVQEEFRRDMQERRSPPSPVEERRESESRERDSVSDHDEKDDDDDYEDDTVPSHVPAVIRASDSDESLAPSTIASTVHQDDTVHIPTVFVPPQRQDDMSMSSHPDISTAAASFVTAPPALDDTTTTDDSMRTVPSYTHMEHHAQGPGWGPV